MNNSNKERYIYTYIIKSKDYEELSKHLTKDIFDIQEKWYYILWLDYNTCNIKWHIEYSVLITYAIYTVIKKDYDYNLYYNI